MCTNAGSPISQHNEIVHEWPRQFIWTGAEITSAGREAVEIPAARLVDGAYESDELPFLTEDEPTQGATGISRCNRPDPISHRLTGPPIETLCEVRSTTVADVHEGQRTARLL